MNAATTPPPRRWWQIPAQVLLFTTLAFAAVLRSDPAFRHLGRGTFTLAADSARSVAHVVAIRSDALTRSSSAFRTVVVPRARAASTAPPTSSPTPVWPC